MASPSETKRTHLCCILPSIEHTKPTIKRFYRTQPGLQSLQYNLFLPNPDLHTLEDRVRRTSPDAPESIKRREFDQLHSRPVAGHQRLTRCSWVWPCCSWQVRTAGGERERGHSGVLRLTLPRHSGRYGSSTHLRRPLTIVTVTLPMSQVSSQKSIGGVPGEIVRTRRVEMRRRWLLGACSRGESLGEAIVKLDWHWLTKRSWRRTEGGREEVDLVGERSREASFIS